MNRAATMPDPSLVAQMAGVGAFIAAIGGIRMVKQHEDGPQQLTAAEQEFLRAFAHNALLGKRVFVGLAKGGAVVGGIVSAAIAVWQVLHDGK